MKDSFIKKVFGFASALLFIVIIPIFIPTVAPFLGFSTGIYWAYAMAAGVGFAIFCLFFGENTDADFVAGLIIGAAIFVITLIISATSSAMQYKEITVKVSTIMIDEKTINLDPPKEITFTVKNSELKEIIKSREATVK